MDDIIPRQIDDLPHSSVVLLGNSSETETEEEGVREKRKRQGGGVVQRKTYHQASVHSSDSAYEGLEDRR